jgi:hypothetical protein
MIKSSFLLGSILPNFALWDQGGAQARRAAPLSGPVARPSLGAGRPGNQSLSSAEDDPWAGIPATCTDPPRRLIVGCPYSPLNVASELARMGRRTSRPGRPDAGQRFGPRQAVSASTNPYQRPEGTVPTPHRCNYLTSRSDEQRAPSASLRDGFAALDTPDRQHRIAGMRKGERDVVRTLTTGINVRPNSPGEPSKACPVPRDHSA